MSDAGVASAAFRENFNKLATLVFHEGRISRVDLARVRITLMIRPRVVAELQAVVLSKFEAACASGVIPAGEVPAAGVGAPDWVAIFELIMKYLPQLIELIMSLI